MTAETFRGATAILKYTNEKAVVESAAEVAAIKIVIRAAAGKLIARPDGRGLARVALV